ncbi:MAG: Ig-like domain-containing protein, partial [Chloroflexota bacterium]
DDSVQIVNLKEPGTNNLPTANSLVGSNAQNAVSFEPLKITVTGQDPDQDPLWFSIEDDPDNGFFVAPLYPYFIDDYRVTAGYSPQIAAAEGEAFAWSVAQDPNAMRDYIKDLCEEDIRRTDLPRDFVRGIEYFAVDDDGYTYIYDNFYKACTPGGSTVAPFTRPRISVWDQNGLFVGQQERSTDSRPLRSVKFNVDRGTIIATQSDGSSTGNSLVNISNIQPEIADEPVIEAQTYGLWNEINDIYVGSAQPRRSPEYKNAGGAAFDNTNGILYVIGDRNQNAKGMVALKPARCNNIPEASADEKGPEGCLDLIDVMVYSSSIVQSTKWDEFPGVGVDAMFIEQIEDIALDSSGAVHIISEDRIHKFGAPTVEANGNITVGDYIGWLGACDSGPNCDYVNQRSIGYSCTDETCFNASSQSGSRQGQFNRPAALAFDPNDVLYVADSGNDRVQRFSNDGLFAGEAVSTGDGDGFVLGDFGSPSNIVVNRGSFYVFDRGDEIVHVFDASVIHGIDETSAWVEYQSENNFVGTDTFTFVSSDGFRNGEGETQYSAPATVAVNVTRNYRPPQATAGLTVTTTEDTPVTITLEGYDIDGDLDTLSFIVDEEPGDGTLSGSGQTLVYTPRQDFDDQDSLYFVVNDGRFNSDSEEFVINIVPVNDPPEIEMDSSAQQIGLGFPFTLQATVYDPEIQDDLTVEIDWGDGTIEQEGTATEDGTLTGPVINASGTVSRTVLAYHTYETLGDTTLTLTVSDPSGEVDTV